ncbi:hypothetical protein M9H77_03611 [Catharanthus roseus]|uniref:Uncharacterized protein n=1 Tax=Catharanthus roseus TaxID=4058 RepID=A0ACC0CC55_CATRO|nr:hypothetical protein M9H77_03611 [Catharanthus roseus]
MLATIATSTRNSVLGELIRKAVSLIDFHFIPMTNMGKTEEGREFRIWDLISRKKGGYCVKSMQFNNTFFLKIFLMPLRFSADIVLIKEQIDQYSKDQSRKSSNTNFLLLVMLSGSETENANDRGSGLQLNAEIAGGAGRWQKNMMIFFFNL